MSLRTPVALFIFNRPGLTQAVFQTIADARPQKLLVVADGPRFPAEEEQCRQARAVLERVDWDCEVLTNFAEHNLGCKRRISGGLDWVFEQCVEAIILEDDCLPHPDFFGFCAQMLDRYRDDERLMMVGGMNYLRDRLQIEESYTFSRYFAVWGWATWRRAWEKYDIAMEHWAALKAQGQLRPCGGQSVLDRYLSAMFDAAAAGQDTWDVQWAYSCVFQNGLSVVPCVNLVSNIGVTGTHSRRASDYHNLPTFALPSGALRHPGLVFPDARYDNALARQVLRPLTPTPLQQSFRRVRRKVGRLLRAAVRRVRPNTAAGGAG